MMNTGKFASLHGGLIARKGEAVPAATMMNPFQPSTAAAAPMAAETAGADLHPASGGRVEEAAHGAQLHSEKSVAVETPLAGDGQHPSEDRAEVPEPSHDAAPSSQAKPPAQAKKLPGAKMKAITFRLDPAKYRRIQVAAAKEGTNAQDLLRDAVDRQLAFIGEEKFPNCRCIRGEGFCN